MKSGSIVTLKKPLKNEDIAILARNGFHRYFEMGEKYMVDFLREPLRPDLYPAIKVCIVLVEFPEYEDLPIDVSADLFTELLPPNLDVNALLEEATVLNEIPATV